MSLTALTDEKEIYRAFNTCSQTLKKGGKRLKRTVGYPGGHEERYLYWHPKEQFWTSSEKGRNRYWCMFGVADPTTQHYLNITCEINSPLKEINRRCAGVYVKDEYGKIYLAHTGKIGGGRENIGKSLFINKYRGKDKWAPVLWSDGSSMEVVIIGCITSSRLIQQVAQFVHEVDRIKKLADVSQVRGKSEKRKRTVKRTALTPFTPEFTGVRKRYRVSNVIESRCNHGNVVNELTSQLEKKGLQVVNNFAIDALAWPKRGRPPLLFELKTDITSTSIYSAVGQLMIHAAYQKKEPQKVLVLPEIPKKNLTNVLKQLDITVLTYKWKNRKPTFPSLNKILND